MTQLEITGLALAGFALFMLGYALGSIHRAPRYSNYVPRTAAMPAGSIPPKPRKS